MDVRQPPLGLAGDPERGADRGEGDREDERCDDGFHLHSL